MADFAYKAKKRNGKYVAGVIPAKSKAGARRALMNRGLRPLKITPSGGNDAPSKSGGKHKFIYRDPQGNIQISLIPELPTTKELALFSKQFSLMVENGIPLLRALNILKSQQVKQNFSSIIGEISQSVEKGASLHEAIEPFPGIFDQLYVAMIRAGETSGRLDVILRKLVEYIEKKAKIKSQIKKAMAYPIIVIFVAIAVITALLAFVVPSFAKQFKDSGQELPGLTQFVVNMSDALVNNWTVIIGILIGLGVILKAAINTEKGRVVFDNYILKMPVFGDVLIKISVGRFCSTMSTMLSSGVSILESLTICAAASGNKKMETFILGVREDVSKGEAFATPLMRSDFFPQMVASMVEIGEQSGTLDDTLAKVTEIYDDEVETAIDTMTSMIEPAMIIIIGSIVGFIVIAMYLPIFDLATTVGG